MILTADAGNTQTVFGIWYRSRLLATARVSTHQYKTVDEWKWLLTDWFERDRDRISIPIQLNSAVVASVVPQINSPLRSALNDLGISEVRFLEPESNHGLQHSYDGFSTLGADRIADALAGIAYHGKDLIVLDFGTALTANLISDAVFRGGVILPGISSSLQALFSSTSKLPHINFRNKPEILGTNTVDSIENGVYFGWKSMITGIIYELKRISGKKPETVRVVATGGISASLGFSSDLFDVVDVHLTHRGLHLYAQS